VVALLHGFSGSSGDWADLVPSLRSLGRASVAVDLVGHGGTEATSDPERYTMRETVADLDRILATLGIPRADWVGYSMGGRVALPVARAHPERVNSLALESASAGIEDPEARARRRREDETLARRIEERGIEWFADYWSTLPLFETQWEQSPATRARLLAR